MVVKVPSPFPNTTETLAEPESATARSRMPSPLKSAAATHWGLLPTATSVLTSLSTAGGPNVTTSAEALLTDPRHNRIVASDHVTLARRSILFFIDSSREPPAQAAFGPELRGWTR